MSEPTPVEGPDGDIIGFECAECGTLKTSETKATAHCADSTNSINRPNGDNSTNNGSETVREHYERAEPALKAVGGLDAERAAQPLGNHDFFGWYKTAPATDPGQIESGFDQSGTVFTLAADYSELVDALDRVLYSTISYADVESVEWRPFKRGADGKEWKDGNKATPDYGDLAGFAPFADIDLEDEYKERPLPDDQQAIVERAIEAYIDEFGDLAGGRDSVFALDSVGGAYVFVSPQSTAPIAEHYAEDARAKIYEELAGRMNDWLDEARQRVNERVPGAEGLFEPDLLNNNNRLYKAPLSIHKSIDGVVHPIDTESVAYDFTPFDHVDDELVDTVEAWGEEFTDTAHGEQIGAVVSTLWDEYDETDWKTVLDAWLEDVRERERERQRERERREERQRERRKELAANMDDDEDIDDIIAHQNVTPAKQDVFDAIDMIDVRDVIREHATNDWDTSNRGHETTFDPSWRNSGSGMSCAVPNGQNRFIDNGTNNGGGPVMAYAVGNRIVTAPDQRLTGKRFWRAVDAMRADGYQIPVYIPDVEASDAGKTPYWGLVKAAVALGVCDSDDLVEREGEDGSTYRALPDDGGETYRDTLEALEAGGIDHGRDGDDYRGSGDPVAALPLAQLDALSHEERRRFARKRGMEWPTTEDARERLFQTITEVMANGDDRVVDAPTSLGKSYTIAATPWDAPQYDDATGGAPVIHLSKTTDARDEAVKTSENAGVEHFVLLGRTDACPCAAGDHDPHEVEDNDRQPITVDGTPVSEWMDHQCDEKGLPFSVAHAYARENNDQGVELPCSEDGECYSTRQWDDYREGEHKLVHATHNFAFVPGVRAWKNVVFDEEPDFGQELTTERVREAISAYLRAIDAPVTAWEQFISTSQFSGGGGDAGRVKSQLKNAIDEVPEREWFVEHPDAHILAPALARAIFHAKERGNERRAGRTPYEPPRLDAQVTDEDAWNREWVSVVLNNENDVETVRVTPDMNMARSVIGLDAHPAMPVWQINTLPHIKRRKVLEPEERRLWRRYERGLRVVQVGDATRPLASDHAAENYVSEAKLTALLDQLREEYGDGFRTAITTNAVEDSLRDLMREGGITPETMHYGEEKSRNDFAEEEVGFVNGCIDPGDGLVINLLAELDLDAEPERAEEDCDHCGGHGCNQCLGTGKARAHGRAFEGEDAETAAEILASVRENHTAQAAGRYARNPDNPRDSATVFVRTDAMPPGFADVQVPGVVWAYGDKQRALAAYLRDQTSSVSAKDAADVVGCSKRHALKTLRRWADDGVVQALPGEGAHGATLYSESGLPTAGVADFDGETTNSHVQDSNTFQFVVCEPTTAHTPAPRPAGGGDGSTPAPQGDQTTLDGLIHEDDGGGR